MDRAGAMIILINPRATKPQNRRFPLSVMMIGASISNGENWEIVDGNRPDIDPLATITALVEHNRNTADPVRAIAFTVMPGPQLASAVSLTKAVKARHTTIPVVWGGNFGSLYPAPVLNAPTVDWLVRGQGDRTFVELLDVLHGNREPTSVMGLCFRNSDGSHHIGKERAWVGPGELPAPPYHKIPVADYLHATFLGKRNGVYQSSIGCPYACNFCGVISVFGRREQVQHPSRTAEHLSFLIREYGMDSVHFYDNNFFLTDAHAREIADHLMPLGLRWWCESRVDALMRFSDETFRRLKKAGLVMVFCGAESGNDDVLKKMQKGITTDQIIGAAERTRQFGIVPEFSFVFGDPDEPEQEIDNTLTFIRKLKGINPAMELIPYFYTPTPQRRDTYGNVDPLAGTPDTLDEWASPQWVNWMSHMDHDLPWMDRKLKARVDNFELVLKSRFPSVHDRYTQRWGKVLGSLLAQSRWRRGDFSDPHLLRHIRRLARIRPDDKQAYGHLRADAKA
jgi:hypothetical protein